MYHFRWNKWNVDHIGKHDIAPESAEYIVNHARRPYPRRAGEDKFLVRGQAEDGAYIQVVFVLDDDGTVYVIHARPLTETEKRVYRRRSR